MRIVSNIMLVVVTVFMVIAFSFSLMRYQSKRPLQAVMANNNFSQHTTSVYNPAYIKFYSQYGLDLPSFYFSIGNLALPSSYNYLPECEEKDFLIYWSCKTGDPQTIIKIYQSLICFHNEEWRIPPAKVLNLQRVTKELIASRDIDTLRNYYKQYETMMPREALTSSIIKSVKEININSSWKQWLPILHFHKDNQFDWWLSGLINESNGIYTHSWITKNAVISSIKKPLIITFIITLISMVVIVFYSLVFAAELFLNKGNKVCKYLLNIFHFLYSIPAFFIGAILILFLANPYHLQLLPANFAFAPIVEGDCITLISIVKSWKYFVLPVITLSFGAIVFFTLMLYRSFEEECAKNYVLSVKMMGVTNRTIIYKYVLKNAIYSTSTFLFLLFPALLSGSVIVEQMFSIAGIGNLLMLSARSQDVPMLISLLGLIGSVTAFSFLALDYFQQKIGVRLIVKEEGKNEMGE